MKKITLAFICLIIVIATHLVYVFRQVEGVVVSDILVSHQDLIERYNYQRQLKRLLVKQNVDALIFIINVDCGGGAGCYDHGAVLVRVLVFIGDPAFSKLIATISKKDLTQLHGLLSAGYEYGGFTQYPSWESFVSKHPLTFSKLP